jgi:hypothetical protein
LALLEVESSLVYKLKKTGEAASRQRAANRDEYSNGGFPLLLEGLRSSRYWLHWT